jgi:hypothetical protein
VSGYPISIIIATTREKERRKEGRKKKDRDMAKLIRVSDRT